MSAAGNLVNDQYRVLATQVASRPSRRRTQDLLFVPDRPRQQVLEWVRTPVSGRCGDAPAVVFQAPSL